MFFQINPFLPLKTIFIKHFWGGSIYVFNTFLFLNTSLHFSSFPKKHFSTENFVQTSLTIIIYKKRFGECVVHHRTNVIRPVVLGFSFFFFPPQPLMVFLYIVHVYCYMFISVRTCMLMPESQGVHKLVNYPAYFWYVSITMHQSNQYIQHTYFAFSLHSLT